LPKEMVEACEKSLRIRAPALKFKDEGTKFLSKACLRRHEDKFAKCDSIKKAGIRLPGLGSITGKIGIHRDGDLFPDFGAKVEISRQLFGIMGQLGRTGGTVEGMIDANGTEKRGSSYCVSSILGQCGLAEKILRI